VQVRRLKEKPQSLSTSELLVSVDEVLTSINFDMVTVLLRLRNGSNTATTITITSRT
jgi:hypothetical protein